MSATSAFGASNSCAIAASSSWTDGQDSCAMPPIPDRVHQRVTWELMTEATIIRTSIGGYPILPVGEPWPVCAEDRCHRRMALFLQLDVEDRFGVPFETGSTLSVF